MILCTVPPFDCLLVSPGMMPFTVGEYFDVPYILFDIGFTIAKAKGVQEKVRFAYRTYSRFIDTLEQYSAKGVVATGGVALVVIPDDFELKTHRKLADVWLGSTEMKLITRRLNDLGYDVFNVLAIRRVIDNLITMNVDLSPFLKYIKEFGEDLVYGIPANESTAFVNWNVKCRYHPDLCIMHIRLITNALLNHLQDPWIHLMGPPVKSVLKHFYTSPTVKSADTTSHTSNAIKSADTTGHRLDIVHYNAKVKGSGKMNDLLMYLRLRHYLVGG